MQSSPISVMKRVISLPCSLFHWPIMVDLVVTQQATHAHGAWETLLVFLVGLMTVERGGRPIAKRSIIQIDGVQAMKESPTGHSDWWRLAENRRQFASLSRRQVYVMKLRHFWGGGGGGVSWWRVWVMKQHCLFLAAGYEHVRTSLMCEVFGNSTV